MNADPALLHDPERHFGFSQCHGCMGKPCSRLRNGHTRPGEFIFVNRHALGIELCAFTAHKPHAIAKFLATIDIHRLSRHYSRIVSQLTEVERYRANPEAFINGWDDHPGIVEFLIHLLDHRIIVALGVPSNFAQDLKTKGWFHRFDPTGPLPGEVQTPTTEVSDTGEAFTNKRNTSISQNQQYQEPVETDEKRSRECTVRG